MKGGGNIIIDRVQVIDDSLNAEDEVKEKEGLLLIEVNADDK